MDELEDRATSIVVEISTLDENDHDLRPPLYRRLGQVLLEQFFLSKNTEYLDEAIAAVREALKTAPSGRLTVSLSVAKNVCLGDALVSLANEPMVEDSSIACTIRQRKEHSKASNELSRRVPKPFIVQTLQCPATEAPIFQIATAQWLFEQSLRLGSDTILDTAIGLAKSTLETAARGKTRDLLESVYRRILTYKYFRQSGTGLDDAMTLGYRHAKAMADHGPKHVAAVFYDGLKTIEQMQERILTCRTLDRSKIHLDHYRNSGDLASLNQAIETCDFIPDDISEGKLLGEKCLELAICFKERSLAMAFGLAIDEEMMHLSSAAARRKYSFATTDETRKFSPPVTDFAQALHLGAMASELIPQNDEKRCFALHAQGELQMILHECTRKIDHLKEAIILFEEAVNTAQVNTQLPSFICVLAHAIHTRYLRLNDGKDLETAETLIQMAIELNPNDLGCLRNLFTIHANILQFRFLRTGDSDDLHLAIQKATKVEEMWSTETGSISGNRLSLGWLYHLKYLRFGHEDDIEVALESFREEMRKRETSSSQHEIAYALSEGLMSRYRRTRIAETLEESISILQKAMSSLPAEHGWKKALLRSLGERWHMRYESTSDLSDLEKAISCVQEGLQGLAKTDAEWGPAATNLATMIFHRASRNLDLNEAEVSQQLLLEIIENSAMAPWRRAQAVSITLHRFRNASEPFLRRHNVLARRALDLLPHTCSRELSREDQQEMASFIEYFAAESCSLSLRLSEFEEALQRVEYGRGLILGNLIDKQDDLTDLKERHPDLAERYESIRYRAFGDIKAERLSQAWESSIREKRQAQREMLQFEEEIRCKTGFKNFLKPPPLHEMAKNASYGPVVIVNCSDYRSDAIIIKKEGAYILPLCEMMGNRPEYFRQALERQRSGAGLRDTNPCMPDLWKHSDSIPPWTRKSFRESRPVERDHMQPSSMELLKWLWHSCVLPILLALREKGMTQNDDGDPPRVWWIGSGAATSLPFHAAGDLETSCCAECSEKQRDSCDHPKTCLDWVASSYAPTVKALQHARARAEKVSLVEPPSITVVTMPSTPGLAPLSGVRLEQKAVEEATRSFGVKSFLEFPTAEEVLNCLPGSHILHFACHGMSDPIDPSASHVLLQKKGPNGDIVPDQLKLGDILDRTVKNGSENWLVYLSACSTAQVKADKMGDESLHLASAFQVAGFAHAIGSLWSADDEICVEVARLFYKELSRYEGVERRLAVTHALRKAVIQIRDKHYNKPALWAPFIHFGA